MAKKEGRATATAKAAKAAKDYQNAYRDAYEQTNDEDYGELVNSPPGRYTMQLVQAKVGEFGGEPKLLHKWRVVKGSRREDFNTAFERLTEDGAIWMMRLLRRLGAENEDLEPIFEANPEDVDDAVLDLWKRFIEERLCAIVSVAEKDGYHNLRVQKFVDPDDVDEKELFDPIEEDGDSGKKSASRKAAPKKEEKEDPPEESEASQDEQELLVGDEVEFKKGRTFSEGTIVGFDGPETALVLPKGKKRNLKIPGEDITFIRRPDGGDSGEPPTSEESDSDDDGVEESGSLKVGDDVFVKEYGTDVPGKIVSISPKGGPKSIRIQFGGDPEDEDNFGPDDVLLPEDANAAKPKKTEMDVGDEVVIEHDGTDKSGVIKAIRGKRVQVTLKKGGNVWVLNSAVAFETE